MASVLYMHFDGELVAEDRGGTVSHYVSDTLGSTMAITDSAGTVTDNFEYWPYGEEFSRTGSNPTPFTWVGTLGYFKDAASRFYVRMRSYAATAGSWMRVDPLWPGQSAYGYVRGRPVDRIDPWGLIRLNLPPVSPVGGWFGDSTIVLFEPGRPLDYNYGNYCGAKNPPCPTDAVPLDCVDRACYRHDQCTMNTPNFFGYNMIHCHCDLAQEALACVGGGCLFGASGSGPAVLWRISSCFKAADEVLLAYGALCGVLALLVPKPHWGPPVI